MRVSDWENTTEWREKVPTKKQCNMLHGLVAEMMTGMSRGQVHDLINKMMGKANYPELKKDLEKKNRSWKWKEDLK
jgi:hypothetical protein